MTKHYLKIILRTFLRSKVYTCINITGLSTGMAVFILIMLYVNYEYSVDQYHENKDNIYRVVQQEKGNMHMGDDRFAVTMAPLGPVIKDELSEVKCASRIAVHKEAIIKTGEETTLEPLVHGVDPDAFSVFTFEYVHGNPKDYLKNKYSAVITESIARKYYKDAYPLGKTFRFQDGQDFEVVGVIKDMPAHSHFRMNIMVPFETLLEITNSTEKLQNWGTNAFYTYILLNEGNDPYALEAKFPGMLEKYMGEVYTRLYLQDFSTIHIHSDIPHDIAATVDVNRLHIFITIAILILLIASINYMNLASALAGRRAKEVGIRKVVGAYQHNIITQFIGESVLITVFSLVFSLLIIILILPYFKQFIGIDLPLNLLQRTDTILMILFVCGVVGIGSGSYPSFVLSTLKPTSILKGSLTKAIKGASLRNVLVIAQFTISGFLIMVTLIITRQLNFIQNKDMGYDREHIVTLSINDPELLDKIPVLKNEIRKISGVLSVASSSNYPNNITSATTVRWPGKPDDVKWPIYSGFIDYDFIDLYDMEIIEGRNFSVEAGDEHKSILINESAASSLPWDDPIGHELIYLPDIFTIIGVVKDFHQHSLHLEIMPLQLFCSDNFWNMSIKISSTHIEETLAGIKDTKASFSIKYPFTYAFFDDEFNTAYKVEQKTGDMAHWFTLVTIIIACLGLYGLAAFTAEQRIKEVGIRKILGARVHYLIFMLSKDFTVLVIISFILSAPLAYFVMQQWLSDFAYHISIEVFTFAAALILMILISWLTVAYRTFKVANCNPVNALKEE